MPGNNKQKTNSKSSKFILMYRMILPKATFLVIQTLRDLTLFAK